MILSYHLVSLGSALTLTTLWPHRTAICSPYPFIFIYQPPQEFPSLPSVAHVPQPLLIMTPIPPEHFLIPHIHLANHSDEPDSVTFPLGQHPWTSRQKSQKGRLGSQLSNGHQPQRRTQHEESKVISPHHSDYLLPSPCASNCPPPFSVDNLALCFAKNIDTT